MKLKKLESIFLLFFTLIFLSCSMINNDDDENYDDAGILSLSSNTISISINEMGMLNLNAAKNQKSAVIRWSYDANIIKAMTQDNYGFVFKGLKSGSTVITAICGAYKAETFVTVNDSVYNVEISNPYVYCSSDYVSLKPGETQKIFASAFGISGSVINSWNFSIDKPSVASLVKEGNYCWITGISSGIAKITVTNTEVSAYSYSVLVSVSEDGKDACYITTDKNVITVNLSDTKEKSFDVTLKNSSNEAYDNSAYTYTIVDSKGNSISQSESNLSVVQNCGTFNVSISDAGNSMLRIAHPLASYALEVLIIADYDADLSYVNSTVSTLNLNSDKSESVSFSVVNCPDGKGLPDEFVYSFSDNYQDYVDCIITGGSSAEKGDTLTFTAKKNGIVKVVAKHKKAKVATSVLIIIRNVTSSAASVSTYITTDQNHIVMYEGDDEQKITVLIKNAKSENKNSLKWKIENIASDGSSQDVIKWISGTGYSESSNVNDSSRSVSYLSYDITAIALIAPLKKGRATITLSHPDAVYSTVITVIVKSALEKPKESIAISSSTKILKLTSELSTNDISISINSNNIDENKIAWNCDDNNIKVASNGYNAKISYINTTKRGNCFITISYPNATNILKIPVLYAPTIEEVDSMKYIYANSDTYTEIYAESFASLSVTTLGLEEYEVVKWTVTEGLNSIVSIEDLSNCANVTGLNKGTAKIVATVEGVGSVEFTVVVKQYGIEESKASYLTTSQNVIYLQKVGDEATINITGINLGGTLMSKTVWITSDLSEKNFELYPSADGTSAKVVALVDFAQMNIKISNPYSENSLDIKVVVGDKYVYNNKDFSYISLSANIINLIKNGEDYTIQAGVVHTEQNDIDTKGFTFAIENSSIASVSYSSSTNTAFIKPINVGTTVLTVKHADCQDISVPVVVSSSYSAAGIPYITTEYNVVTLLEGETSVITCSLMNALDSNPDNWNWTSDDSTCASVSMNTGNSVIVSGNSIGTATLTVKNKQAPYSIKIIVQVVDSSVATVNPYISLSSNVLTLKKGATTIVSAKLIGGRNDDENYFSWESKDSSIAFVGVNNQNAHIQGLKAGTTYITVTNSRYPNIYSKKIIVRVDDKVNDDVYISTSSKIIELSPDYKQETKITAELINGQVLDAQDFYWQVEDENLLTLKSSADTASITPKGTSGSTYINVSHPKVLNPVKILVLVSKYKKLSFEKSSTRIQQGKINYFQMNIPTTAEDVELTYSASSSIVSVCGTNKVCMIQGVKTGTATVKANLIEVRTKNIIQSAEIALIIDEAPKSDTQVIISQSILNLDIKSESNLTATVVGSKVPTNFQKYLSWSWHNDYGENISLVGGNVISSDTVIISTLKPGSYILDCTYKNPNTNESIVSSTLITVPEAVKKSITLDKIYLSRYKDDGTFTLTATINNGTSEDYANLEWSATKYDGTSILQYTSKGKTCTVSATSVGNSILTARLPSGLYAQCMVVINPSASIDFDAKVVHITPGLSEEIGFTVTPKDATNFSWIMTSADADNANDYWSYSYDYTKSVVIITAKKAKEGGYAGDLNVYANASGASTSSGIKKLSVYCEYKPSLEVSSAKLEILNPDTKINSKKWIMNSDGTGYGRNKTSAEIEDETKRRTFTYSAYPINMEVKVTSSDDTKLGIVSKTEKIISEGGRTSKIGTVVVEPYAEFTYNSGVCINVNGVGKGYDVTQTYQIPVEAYYEAYPLIIDYPNFKAGGYTYIEDNTINLTDGESLDFVVDIDRNYCQNADLSNVSVVYSSNNDSLDAVEVSKNSNGKISITNNKTEIGSDKNLVWTLKHLQDHKTLVDYAQVGNETMLIKRNIEDRYETELENNYLPWFDGYFKNKSIPNTYGWKWSKMDFFKVENNELLSNINVNSYTTIDEYLSLYVSSVKGLGNKKKQGNSKTEFFLIDNHKPYNDLGDAGSGYHWNPSFINYYNYSVLSYGKDDKKNYGYEIAALCKQNGASPEFFILHGILNPENDKQCFDFEQNFNHGECIFIRKANLDILTSNLKNFSWKFLNGYYGIVNLIEHNIYWYRDVSNETGREWRFMYSNVHPFISTTNVSPAAKYIKNINTGYGNYFIDLPTALRNPLQAVLINTSQLSDVAKNNALANGGFTYAPNMPGYIYRLLDSNTLTVQASTPSKSTTPIGIYRNNKLTIVHNSVKGKSLTKSMNVTVTVRPCPSYTTKYALFKVNNATTDYTMQNRWYEFSRGVQLFGMGALKDGIPDWYGKEGVSY